MDSFILKRPPPRLKKLGLYHNLEPIFMDLNQRYFALTIEASIGWGQKRTTNQKRSIRLGSYYPHKKAIFIHPCLDQAIVPHICIERIVFHEMVHAHLPGKLSSAGKLLVHYPEFYEFEKKYPYLEQADRWLKANLPRLLRF
jgi:hypothetical protein